jgi:hypothetical protein
VSSWDASPIWEIRQVPQMGQGRQDIGGFLDPEEDVKWGVNKKGYSHNLAGLDFRITQFSA